MQIERIWAEEIMPRFGEFKTMDYLERTPPDENSVWCLNYEIPDVDEL